MKLVRFHHLKNEAIDSRFPRTGLLLRNEIVADLRVGYARYLTQEKKDPQGREIAALRIAGDIVTMIGIGKYAKEAMESSAAYLAELLESRPAARGPTGEPLFMPLDECKLHAPMRPTKVVGFAISESADSDPRVRIKANNAISSPFRDIVMPRNARQLECETMVGVIIGKGCSNVVEEDVDGKIFGYMGALDVSAAADDMHNTFLPIGPYVVTRDEVPDPMALRITTSVNGEVKRESSTRDMRWNLRRLISIASKTMKLEPGDVILIGPQDRASEVILKLDDVVESAILHVGTMRQHVGNDPSR